MANVAKAMPERVIKHKIAVFNFPISNNNFGFLVTDVSPFFVFGEGNIRGFAVITVINICDLVITLDPVFFQ